MALQLHGKMPVPRKRTVFIQTGCSLLNYMTMCQGRGNLCRTRFRPRYRGGTVKNRVERARKDMGSPRCDGNDFALSCSCCFDAPLKSRRNEKAGRFVNAKNRVTSPKRSSQHVLGSSEGGVCFGSTFDILHLARRSGGTGIRWGLKIPCPSGLAGSNPASGSDGWVAKIGDPDTKGATCGERRCPSGRSFSVSCSE